MTLGKITCFYMVWCAQIFSQFSIQEMRSFYVVIWVEVQSSWALRSWHCISCSCQSANQLDIDYAVCPESYLNRVFSKLQILISFHSAITPSQHFSPSPSHFSSSFQHTSIYKECAVKFIVSTSTAVPFQTWKKSLLSLLHLFKLLFLRFQHGRLLPRCCLWHVTNHHVQGL